MVINKKRKLAIVKRSSIYLGAGLIALMFFTPFYWMVITSLKERSEIFNSVQTWVPKTFNFTSYTEIWTLRPFSGIGIPEWMVNSFIVAFSTAFFSLIIGFLAGYAMSRFRFPGRNILTHIILLTQAIPASAIIIPLYIFIGKLHLLNSLLGLSLVYASFAVPYATFLLGNYFNTVPTSLDEAALIDGCGYARALFAVVIPTSIPGITVTFLFTFLRGWNEYLFALIFLNSYEKWTAPVGLASFRGQYIIQWNFLFAGSALLTLPVLLIFLILQKSLVSGFTAGAVKQ